MSQPTEFNENIIIIKNFKTTFTFAALNVCVSILFLLPDSLPSITLVGPIESFLLDSPTLRISANHHGYRTLTVSQLPQGRPV